MTQYEKDDNGKYIDLIIKKMSLSEKAQFCDTVKQFIQDENHDENKYREFGDKWDGKIPVSILEATFLISTQEKTHKDFWMGVNAQYCQA